MADRSHVGNEHAVGGRIPEMRTGLDALFPVRRREGITGAIAEVAP